MTYFSRSPVDFQFLEMSFSRILVQTGKGIVFQSKTVSFWNMATCRLFISVAIPSLPPLHSENPFQFRFGETKSIRILSYGCSFVRADPSPAEHYRRQITNRMDIPFFLHRHSGTSLAPLWRHWMDVA